MGGPLIMFSECGRCQDAGRPGGEEIRQSHFLRSWDMMAPMKRGIRCGGRPMTVIVLAGGRGRRMKADKAGLDVGGRTLLEHVLSQVEPLFDEVLISLSPDQTAP